MNRPEDFALAHGFRLRKRVARVRFRYVEGHVQWLSIEMAMLLLRRLFSFNLIIFITIAVIGGLYQVLLVVGIESLAKIDKTYAEVFSDGSLLFYAISLILGV